MLDPGKKTDKCLAPKSTLIQGANLILSSSGLRECGPELLLWCHRDAAVGEEETFPLCHLMLRSAGSTWLSPGKGATAHCSALEGKAAVGNTASRCICKEALSVLVWGLKRNLCVSGKETSQAGYLKGLCQRGLLGFQMETWKLFTH